MSEKKPRRSENELLTVVSKMAYDLRHEDQMALSAAFMVAAKTIYINQLGMEQTQDLFQAMADSMDAFEVEKVTVHYWLFAEYVNMNATMEMAENAIVVA